MRKLLQRFSALADNHPLGIAVGILSLYVAARVLVFLRFPILTTQDTWAFVAPDDDLREILESKSTRPGFIYQVLLRIWPLAEKSVFTNESGISVFLYEGTPTVAVVTFILSVAAWVMLAATLASQGPKGRRFLGRR